MATLGLVACGDDEDGPRDNEDDPVLVERGRYLVNDVSQCSFCHTPRRADGMPDTTRFLSGVDCFADIDPTMDGFGCVTTRNLTDHETGLKNATADEIKAAFQQGIGTDGRNMHPIMPYWVFANMAEEDADAIVAYLRTVPGVDHTSEPNELPFVDLPGTAPPIDPAAIPMPESGFADQDSAMRGRYLATQASLCVDCHTPEFTPGMLDFDFSKMMQGGRGFPREQLGFPPVDPYPEIIFTTNLTPHATGLEGYTQMDIIKVMKDGLNPLDEGVCAPTHSGPASPYAGLTDDDVTDIANYLLSLAPGDNAIPEDCIGIPPP
jgi:mono/diheme cytochrome c family protein